MPDNPTYNQMPPFRFWCQTVLPSVYDDSLSYYELLNKVVAYLNILNVNTTATHNEITELQSFVSDYFENLDIQTEINNKLDEMALNGTLSQIIYNAVIDDVISSVQDWLNKHITDNNTIALDSSFELNNAAAQALAVGKKTLNLWDRGENAGTAIDPAAMPENKFIFTPLNTIPSPPSFGTNTISYVFVMKLKFTTSRFMLVVYDAITADIASKMYTINGENVDETSWRYSTPLSRTNTECVLYEPTIPEEGTLDISGFSVNTFAYLPSNKIKDPPPNASASYCRVVTRSSNPGASYKVSEVLMPSGNTYTRRNIYTGGVWTYDDWGLCLTSANIDAIINPKVSLTYYAVPAGDSQIALTSIPVNSYCIAVGTRFDDAPVSTPSAARVEVRSLNNAGTHRLITFIRADGRVYECVYNYALNTWVNHGWNLYNQTSCERITRTNRDAYFIDANNAAPNCCFTILGSAKIFNTPYGTKTTNNRFSTFVGVPEWEASQNYVRGDFVMYNNIEYTCIAAHTSTSSFNLSMWRNVAWDNTAIYSKNTIVKYNTKYYYCCKGMTSSSYNHDAPESNPQWWKPSYENPVLRNICGYIDGTLITFGSAYEGSAGVYQHQVFITGTQAGPSLNYAAPNPCRTFTRTYFASTGWSDWQIQGESVTPSATNIILMKKLLAPYLTAPYGTEGAVPCASPTAFANPMYVDDPAYIHDLNNAPANSMYQIDLDAVGDTDANNVYHELLANNPLPGVSGTVYTFCWSYNGFHAKVQMYFALKTRYVNMLYRYQYLDPGAVWTPWRAAGDTRYGAPASGAPDIVLVDLPADWKYYGTFTRIADFKEGGAFADFPFSAPSINYVLAEKTEFVSGFNGSSYTHSTAGLYTFTSADWKWQCWKTASGNIWLQLNNETQP